MENIKVELKNVKYSESLSEETHAYTATIYVDGKKAGSAKNNGHGGETDIWWDDKQAASKVSEMVDGLPMVETDFADSKDPSKKWSYKQRVDGYIDSLLVEFLEAKDLKRLLRNRVVVFQEAENFPGKGDILQTKTMKADQLKQTLALGEKKLTDAYEADKVLNLLPFEEALKVYRQALR